MDDGSSADIHDPWSARPERGGHSADELLPAVYSELRRLAARQLRRERSGHTLQPTALAHEAFLRMRNQPSVHFAGRTHFLAVAAQQTRRVLVDHARRRDAIKRGSTQQARALEEHLRLPGRDQVDLLALEQALTRLEALDPTAARVVVARFYGGMTEVEIAEEMGISERWVQHHWAHARAWLRKEMLAHG